MNKHKREFPLGGRVTEEWRGVDMGRLGGEHKGEHDVESPNKQ